MPAACRSASEAPIDQRPDPRRGERRRGVDGPGRAWSAGAAVVAGPADSSLVGVRPSVDSVWRPSPPVRSVSSSGPCRAAIATRSTTTAATARTSVRRDDGRGEGTSAPLQARRHLVVVDHRGRLGDRADGRAGRQPELRLVGEAAVEVVPEVGTVAGRGQVPQGGGERGPGRDRGAPAASSASSGRAWAGVCLDPLIGAARSRRAGSSVAARARWSGRRRGGPIRRPVARDRPSSDARLAVRRFGAGPSRRPGRRGRSSRSPVAWRSAPLARRRAPPPAPAVGRRGRSPLAAAAAGAWRRPRRLRAPRAVGRARATDRRASSTWCRVHSSRLLVAVARRLAGGRPASWSSAGVAGRGLGGALDRPSAAATARGRGAPAGRGRRRGGSRARRA